MSEKRQSMHKNLLVFVFFFCSFLARLCAIFSVFLGGWLKGDKSLTTKGRVREGNNVNVNSFLVTSLNIIHCYLYFLSRPAYAYPLMSVDLSRAIESQFCSPFQHLPLACRSQKLCALSLPFSFWLTATVSHMCSLSGSRYWHSIIGRLLWQ